MCLVDTWAHIEVLLSPHTCITGFPTKHSNQKLDLHSYSQSSKNMHTVHGRNTTPTSMELTYCSPSTPPAIDDHSIPQAVINTIWWAIIYLWYPSHRQGTSAYLFPQHMALTIPGRTTMAGKPSLAKATQLQQSHKFLIAQTTGQCSTAPPE